MSNPNRKQQMDESEFDVEQMKTYMSLSVEEKLKHLEQLNQFTQALMPESNQRIWEQLKREGF